MAMSLPWRSAETSLPNGDDRETQTSIKNRSIWQSVAAKLPACEVRNAETRARDDDLGALNLRGFLWTLFVFKMATIAVIFWAAGGSSEANMLISATTWPWLIIPGIVIFGWLVIHVRKRRMRARRAELIRSEWMLDQRETMETVRGANDREGVDDWANM